MVHEQLIVDVVELGAGGNFHDREAARLEDAVELPHGQRVVFDVLQDIEQEHDVDGSVGQRAAGEIEVEQRNVGLASGQRANRFAAILIGWKG